jgi:hypothetical protein
MPKTLRTSLMKNLFAFAALSFLFTLPQAFAVDRCPKSATLNEEFFSKYWVGFEFIQSLPLSGNKLTFLGTHSAFRRYWGTEVRIIVNHEDGLKEIPAGAILFMKPNFILNGHADGSMNPKADWMTSNLEAFWMVPSPYGINLISVHSQPGSSVKVKRLEQLLGAVMLCKPYAQATAADSTTDDNSSTLPSTEP